MGMPVRLGRKIRNRLPPALLLGRQAVVQAIIISGDAVFPAGIKHVIGIQIASQMIEGTELQ